MGRGATKFTVLKRRWATRDERVAGGTSGRLGTKFSVLGFSSQSGMAEMAGLEGRRSGNLEM
jgi:hypothetical protein